MSSCASCGSVADLSIIFFNLAGLTLFMVIRYLKKFF